MTFVYILKCADDTLYTGYTTDLKKRLKTHNSKLGAKYTRGRIPVKLVYFELCETKSEALKREKKIKKLKKSEKENMIQNFDTKNLFKYVEGDVNGY